MRNIFKFNKKQETILCLGVWLYFILGILTSPNLYAYNQNELHAYNIATNLNILEIFELMRYEGHTFVWYLILKPFGYFNIFYPWILKALNISFLISALAIMWKKAPFHPIVKSLIMLTLPFFNIYSSIARCYSIGILMLFGLATLFKNKTKNPILYSILIFFTANTSLMATVGAIAFGILLIKDLFLEFKNGKNNKKDIFIVILIGILTGLILYIQWHNPVIPDYSLHFIPVEQIKISLYKTVLYYNKYLIMFFAFMVVISSLLYFKKDSLFFIVLTEVFLLTIFAKLYAGDQYHHVFTYIYLVIAYWIAKDTENFRARFNNFFLSVFILSSIYIFGRLNYLCSNITVTNKYKFDSSDFILYNVPKNSTIYTNLYYQTEIIYLNKQYDLRNYKGDKIANLEDYKNMWKDKSGEIVDIKAPKCTGDKNVYVLTTISEQNNFGTKYPVYKWDYYALYTICEAKNK